MKPRAKWASILVLGCVLWTGAGCGDNRRLPESCAALGACPPACGNGLIEEGEACDDGNAQNGDGCDLNCAVSACGNGARAPDEECDDGNLLNDDSCDRNCTLPACGNGAPTSSEACDDGNAENGDDCDVNCTLPACGNGALAPREACDDGNLADGDGCDSNCTETACRNGIATAGEACDDGNLGNGDGCDTDCTASLLAYVKAAASDAGDELGHAIALSADGATLAVSAWAERSAAVGVGGDPADDAAVAAGAVYVFARAGGAWALQAYVKASNTAAFDRFGASLALSADGATLAVGAIGEDSGAVGVGGNQADNTAEQSGAVYVFARTGGAWAQEAYVKASNTGVGDVFGWAVALAADGATLAVGAPSEDSPATGVGGSQTGNGAQASGAVYVFARAGGAWAQTEYLKASNTGAGDDFGGAVALSGDGATLAVGAREEDSAATGIGGNQTSNAAPGAGAVYVFRRTGALWAQQAYAKASNAAVGHGFGASVALSSDGAALAVGAPQEAGGAAYVFARSGAAWAEQAALKAQDVAAGDRFGASVALSGDGATLAVGADDEDSAATGVGGDPAGDAAPRAGAVYEFARAGSAWTQQAYVKATNTDADDHFGACVALSGDGAVLAVGAPGEASVASGVGGDPADNAAPFAGAAYLYY